VKTTVPSDEEIVGAIVARVLADAESWPEGVRSVVHESKRSMVSWYRERIEHTLTTVLGADVGKCKGCGAKVFWVRNKNGRPQPISVDGVDHHADCPHAAAFRRK
jgi:hypothetical protein